VGGTYPNTGNMSSSVSLVIGNINSFAAWNSTYFAYRHLQATNILFVDGHVDKRYQRTDGFPHGFYFYDNGGVYE
jgi:prepilin-type processing-associated H-X9-DG protein